MYCSGQIITKMMPYTIPVLHNKLSEGNPSNRTGP